MDHLSPVMSFRLVRTGCAGCLFVLLVVALAAGCAVGWGMVQWRNQVQATEHAVIPLAPPIAESDSGAQARGRFYSYETDINIPVGVQIWLSSAAEGNAPLSTDDLAILQVTRPDGTTETWQHDFRTAAREAVAPIPAFEITRWFQPGHNRVALILEDVQPVVYSSTPYFLRLDAGETASGTTNPKRIILPPQRRHGTAIVSATATMAAPPVGSKNTLGGMSRAESRRAGGEVWWRGGIIILGGTGVWLLWQVRPRSPKTSPMRGWLTVYDTSTGRRTGFIDLSRFPRGVGIIGTPPGVVPFPTNQPVTAKICPAAGRVVLCRALTDGQFDSGTVLQPDTEARVGDAVLEYRDPFDLWQRR